MGGGVKKSKVAKNADVTRPYDVVSVWPSNLLPLNLTQTEKNEIIKVFGAHKLSEGFPAEYGYKLAGYIWDVWQVSNATPAKVSSRLKNVRTKLQELSDAMNKLQQPERLMINREMTEKLIDQKPHVSDVRFWDCLKIFKQHVEFATAKMDAQPNPGRMRGYATQILAMNIDRAIYKETGAYSSLYQKGLFARLLKLALSTCGERTKASSQTGEISKPPKAVMELMRFARDARIPIETLIKLEFGEEN